MDAWRDYLYSLPATKPWTGHLSCEEPTMTPILGASPHTLTIRPAGSAAPITISGAYPVAIGRVPYYGRWQWRKWLAWLGVKALETMTVHFEVRPLARDGQGKDPSGG